MDAISSKFETLYSSSDLRPFNIFKRLDLDNDGYITLSDLKQACDSKSIPLSDEDCSALMAELDKSKTGSVNVGEFCKSFFVPQNSILDQIQRRFIGVSREAGSEYLSMRGTGRRQIASTRRVMSVSEAIKENMKELRAPTGRLSAFYNNLNVPMRNVPWYEDTRYVTEPLSYLPNNPSFMNDSERVKTLNESMGINSMPDLSVPHVFDKIKKNQIREFNKNRIRNRNELINKLKIEKQKKFIENDEQRVAYSTAQLIDYHDRLGSRICHV